MTSAKRGMKTNGRASPQFRPSRTQGRPPEAWQAESMTIFSPGKDETSGTIQADAGPYHFGALGSDWIA